MPKRVGEVDSNTRRLAAMLLGKKVQVKDTLPDQLAHRNVSAVSEIIEVLFADTRKIQPTAVFAKKSYDGMTASPQKRLSSSEIVDRLNTAESFDAEKVKTVGDAPPCWIFSYYNKISTKGQISADMGNKIKNAAAYNLKNINTFLTGRLLQSIDISYIN